MSNDTQVAHEKFDIGDQCCGRSYIATQCADSIFWTPRGRQSPPMWSSF